MDVEIRDGREGDAARVEEMATDTWPDRAVGDYVGDAYPRWVAEAESRDDRRVLVAERDGEVVGVIRGCLLSEGEGWASSLRVAREARGEGVGAALTRATLDWLREAGATVCRNLVFGWNAPSLSLSRATGFEPVTEFRFVTLTPTSTVTSNWRSSTTPGRRRRSGSRPLPTTTSTGWRSTPARRGRSRS